MNLNDLEKTNAASKARVAEFRALPPDEEVYLENFHRYKVRYPYFGYIEAVVGPARFVMFSANDDFIAMRFHWFGPDSFEPKSLSLWSERARTANVVLDVGAFSGVYSLLTATINKSARIHAFEPVRRNYGRLLGNVLANGFRNRITCVGKGIADKAGIATIKQYVHEYALGNGASIFDKESPPFSTEPIDLIAIDDYVRETGIAPELVKIDVEGAELLALDGMAYTLDTFRPELIIEVMPETVRPVIARLESHGYGCLVIDDFENTLAPFDGDLRFSRNLLATPHKA